MGVIPIDGERLEIVSRNLALDRRDEPKIGGSVGGFIALVVCLVIVIVAACTAIYFLFREDREHSGEESLTKRHHQHQQPSSPSYNYHSSSTPSKTWLSSLQGMFASAKGRDGYIMTGDEWDADDERLRPMPGNTRYMSYSPTLDPPFRPPVGRLSTIESTTSVQFEGPSDYRRPSETLPAFSSPTSTVRASSPDPAAIPRSASPESIILPHTLPDSRSNTPPNRKFSTNSDVSTRTFSSGTKFIEAL